MRLSAQDRLTIDITSEARQTTSDTAPLYGIGGITMASVADVANALRLRNVPASDNLTLTFTRGSETVSAVLRPNNHFVTVKAAASQTVQLPVAPVVEGGKFYLPPESLAKLLTRLLRATATYTESGRRLSVVYTVPTLTAAPTKPIEPATPVSPTPNPPTTADTAAPRFTIPGLVVDEKANGVLIRVLTTRANVQYEFIRPNEAGIAYLTFTKTTGDIAALNKSTQGLVKKITAMPIRGGGLQLTLEFDVKRYKIKSTEFKREEGSTNFILLVLSDVDVRQIYKNEKDRKIGEQLQSDKAKWKLDVITLDAGHGGKDGGAQGQNGTAEKTVALSVILKLGKLIAQEWKEMKVVYTRKDDTFIELNERGKIANRNNAKLFVSVHCNSTLGRTAEGMEVYLLGLHKSDDALEVAQRENAVIRDEADYKSKYKDFTDENVIMATMAQSAFSQQSQKLAELVHRNIIARTEQVDRGVKQAGFMVLWTPSMPSILIETGFISNPKEEKFLASDAGQDKLANAILSAIKKYKAEYEAQIE